MIDWQTPGIEMVQNWYRTAWEEALWCLVSVFVVAVVVTSVLDLVNTANFDVSPMCWAVNRVAREGWQVDGESVMMAFVGSLRLTRANL